MLLLAAGKMPGSSEMPRDPCSNPASRAWAIASEMPQLGHCTQESPFSSLIMDRSMKGKVTPMHRL